MSSWLDKDTSVCFIVKAVEEFDPEAIESMKKYPDDPFKHMDFISSALKFIGAAVVKEFGESDRVLTRKKDNEKSRKLREEGNKVYLADEKAQFYEEEALELYTKSIAYAIPNSPEMAMGFANRSAVLLKLERPLESLEDIQSALNSNYPEKLIPKLLIRKAKCFSMLAEHNYIYAKYWLSDVSTEDLSSEEMEMKLQDYSADDYIRVYDEQPILPEIKSSSATFPCASEAIEYSGPVEKSMIASRDIRVGEVLIVEKPYLAFPLEENHCCYCTHCLQSFWNGIPCDNCPNVVFCSENCKKSAWEEYHGFECSALSLLLQYESDEKSRMYATASLRLLIKFSHEAGGLDALKERIRELQNQCVLQDKWYKTQTLESVLVLNSCVLLISFGRFQDSAATAIRILFYLATATNFFGIQYHRSCMSDEVILLEMSKNKDVQFTGGLLIRLLLITRYQSTRARDTTCKVNYVHANMRNRMISPDNHRGLIIAAFSQSIETSCYFNVAEQFVGKFIIFHSVCPIKKGEKIEKALSPYVTWISVPKNLRRSESNACSCLACVEDWPTFDALESFKVRAKSSMYKSMLKDVLKPLSSLHYRLCESHRVIERTDYDTILSTLGRMMKAINDGVHLPCKEHAMILNCLTAFYRITGMTSRRNNKNIDQKRTKQFMPGVF